jgi:hypothetical protein
MLSRPLDRHPGTDYLLVLHNPAGAITAAFHQGRRLDADQTKDLLDQHPWEPSGGG